MEGQAVDECPAGDRITHGDDPDAHVFRCPKHHRQREWKRNVGQTQLDAFRERMQTRQCDAAFEKAALR